MKHDFSDLRLDRVTRRFAGAGGRAFAALNELTLTVRRGEFICLLGPAGCGKSTALNFIAGLMQLSGGSIWLDEQRIDTLPPEKRGFGMVFQNYDLFPHMTVAKNIGFGLRMRGVSAAETAPRVAHALKLVQLTGQEHKLPGQLSGGQPQRVAITRERGRATIYVTHDQDEALSLADRIVVMKDGIVQQIGTPPEVYSQPANLHVARFMGYRNVLELAVEREEGERVFLEGSDMGLVGVRKQPLKGSRAAVAIRPEEIYVGEGPAGLNTISAKVENVEYSGRDSLLDVVTPSGTLLHVRGPVTTRLGDAVRVHVPVERALVSPVE